jgi:hypothetical protein
MCRPDTKIGQKGRFAEGSKHEGFSIKNCSPLSRKEPRAFGFFCFSLTPKDWLRYLRDGGNEKQNDSTLRVIKCPYWHLATKELMADGVPAA